MNIHGNNLILRAIEEFDLIKLHVWANDPKTQDSMGDLHFPSSMEFHRQWFKDQTTDKNNLRFIIDLKDFGSVGLVTLMKLDWRNRHACVGIMIGEVDFRGVGLGEVVIKTLMEYAFKEMNLERLDTSIIEFNIPSFNLFTKKLNWSFIGKRDNYYFRNGKYWAQYLVGITKEQYIKSTVDHLN